MEVYAERPGDLTNLLGIQGEQHRRQDGSLVYPNIESVMLKCSLTYRNTHVCGSADIIQWSSSITGTYAFWCMLLKSALLR